MKKSDFISIREICVHHEIEETFVFRLEEYDLIDIASVQGVAQVRLEDLPKLEKIFRLHSELEINLEGIQTIYHLLEKMDRLKEELLNMRRKIDFLDEL